MSTLLRLRFTKLGKVRFTGHRDVARLFERALRRVSFPVAYSQGFSPRPRVAFGLALPTGSESVAEYLDVMLETDAVIDVSDTATALGEALPTGIEVTGAKLVDSTGDSLQQAVTSCSWELEIPDLDASTATELVASVLAADQLVVTRERKGKEITEDLRPAVLALDVSTETSTGVVLSAELGTQPRALRPAELFSLLHREPETCRVRRTHQWIDHDGARAEPIPLGATAPLQAGAHPS